MFSGKFYIFCFVLLVQSDNIAVSLNPKVTVTAKQARNIVKHISELGCQVHCFAQNASANAITTNQRYADQCGDFPMTKDCNWDPLMMSLVPKPQKDNAFFCSYEGTGKLMMFLTGNEMAQKLLAGIKETFSSTYKKLYFAARPVCLTFENFTSMYPSYWGCSEIQNKTAEFCAKIKPDVLIIAQNMKNNNNFKAPVASVDDAVSDDVTKQVASYFKLWSANTKKIFIIEPNPTVLIQPAATTAKDLADGKPVDTSFIPLQTVQEQIDPGWMRIQAAARSCPKCTAIDIRPTFLDGDKYWYVDQKTNLSYLCDNNRLSPAGVEKMDPVLKDVIGKGIKDL